MKEIIRISEYQGKAVEDLDYEVVERKGKGHPDYIADAIAEEVSVELSKWYLKHFSCILHHNVDKVLVVGGQSWRTFGKGEVVQPIRIIVSGRATTEVTDKGERITVPIGPLVINAAKRWLNKNIHMLNVEKDVIIDYRIGRGAAELERLVKTGIPLANDTSLGIGYAPLSTTEKLTLSVEEELSAKCGSKGWEFLGEDIKVMSLRKGKNINITVAAAIIAQYTSSLEEYREHKEKIKEEVYKIADKIVEGNVEVFVNTADDMTDKTGKGLYLVVTGTSAEHGDDGATGRGNRANGLITPLRPMSLEATAGKNPVSHVGKIYNVLAFQLANEIYSRIPKIREVYVTILSQIGKPINKPQILAISILPEDKASFANMKYEAEEIANQFLSPEYFKKMTDDIVNGRVRLF